MKLAERVKPSAGADAWNLALARLTLLKLNRDLYIALGVSIIAALLFLKYDMRQQPFPPDATLHVYAAQQILQGHAIYRDVGIIKAPLADFLAAFAIFGLQPLGVPDWLATRLIPWLTAAAVVGMTYLAARLSFKRRAIGGLAALGMLSYGFFAQRAVSGPEPKSLLILFALAALVLIQKRQWGWAGVCASLATLAWQPGLMVVAFVLAASLLTADPSSRDRPGASLRPSNRGASLLKSPRLRQFLWALLGAAVPLGLLLLYLIANGALVAAWNAMIGANWVSFAASPTQGSSGGLSANLRDIIAVGRADCFAGELPFVGLGLVGFVGIVIFELVLALSLRQWLSRGTANGLVNLERTPLVLYALGFGAFTLIDFDYCPDLIPLMPVSAIGLGWLVWQIAAGLGRLWRRYGRSEQARQAQTVLLILSALFLLGTILARVFGYALTGSTLSDEVRVAQAAGKLLGPQDRILQFGDALILIFTHRTNASRVLLLGNKSGFGLLAFEPGQQGGLVAGLDRDPPKVIALSRETRPPWTKEFYQWLAKRYTLAERYRLVAKSNLDLNVRIFVRKP